MLGGSGGRGAPRRRAEGSLSDARLSAGNHIRCAECGARCGESEGRGARAKVALRVMALRALASDRDEVRDPRPLPPAPERGGAERHPLRQTHLSPHPRSASCTSRTPRARRWGSRRRSRRGRTGSRGRPVAGLQAVEREVVQRGGADVVADLVDALVGGDQLVARGHVDAVEAGELDGRRADAQVHLAGAGLVAACRRACRWCCRARWSRRPRPAACPR